MQCPRYDDILKGTYNELFISFRPCLDERMMDKIDDLFMKLGCKHVDPWSDNLKSDNEIKFCGTSFEIDPSMTTPIPFYGKQIFMLLKKHKMNNTRFTCSDWRKYVGHDDDKEPTREEIEKHFASQRR